MDTPEKEMIELLTNDLSSQLTQMKYKLDNLTQLSTREMHLSYEPISAVSLGYQEIQLQSNKAIMDLQRRLLRISSLLGSARTLCSLEILQLND